MVCGQLPFHHDNLTGVRGPRAHGNNRCHDPFACRTATCSDVDEDDDKFNTMLVSPDGLYVYVSGVRLKVFQHSRPMLRRARPDTYRSTAAEMRVYLVPLVVE